MPFNMATNFFNITEPVGTIGEAVGDWRGNTKYYERIQGIVMDTRYLMHHYVGKPEKERNALAECIEAVTTRPPIPSAPDQQKVINYSYYMQPRPLMVAESPTPYGTDSET